ncbi:biotin carboxyl carrier protein [Rhizobium tibeticum]|uniref:Biotin carboxyl carrier protein of acetyl-CoA carboxylase n=1 Tax=Rhizobium tibeticum TaxID=501024 RepID=A0A1H8RSI1_9HYPH|nr:acetyl-CoA carboxylase biotin carboxyl carrier protein [Rhizobium tibeticum]SEI08785.1 Biotin carboxyl carrier protein of acetyl-CoA carboxylase [Rhizobium tibeticum]SEO68903.1 biotin carboxyl carrier protein [Rhizobium tibeticum]
MDLEKIKKLIEFVGRSTVSELSVTEGGATVRIIKSVPRRVEFADAAPGAKAPEQTSGTVPAAQDQPADGTGHVVRAPSAGVFHRGPDPSSSPFVEVGTLVEKGQGLCIIEAMKVFNTIPATHAGEITKIVVSDGDDVDVGQPLFEIR